MNERNGPVLVPLDETPVSEQALPWSTYLARRLGCGLILVHAVPPTGRGVAEDINLSQHRLEEIATKLRASGISVATTVEVGEPVDVILGLLQASGARWISLIRRRRSAVARLLPGSTSSQLVHQASVPVLVQTEVPSTAQAAIHPIGPVVVPLDGSAIAEMALPEAVALARGLGQAIHLVRADEVPLAVPDFPYADTAVIVTAVDESEKYLRDVANWLRDQGIRTTSETGWTEPAPLIKEAATRFHGSMVVMATHGRSGIRRLVLGSVADAIIRDASFPVMLIGPHALETARRPLAKVGSPV